MSTVNIEDAQAHLPQIIAGLNPGEPLLITKDGEPLATLTRSRPKQWPCKAGSAKEASHWMAPDFDAPLEEFREYTAEPSAASHDEPEARITRVSRQSEPGVFYREGAKSAKTDERRSLENCLCGSSRLRGGNSIPRQEKSLRGAMKKTVGSME